MTFLVLLRLAPPGFLTVMGPVAVFAFGIAFISPFMQTAALAPFPRSAGSAAALMGFMQMGGGFLGSALSAWVGHPLTAMATIIPAMALISILAHYALTVPALRRMQGLSGPGAE